MRRITMTDSYKRVMKHETFRDNIEFRINDEMLKSNDTYYSNAINERREKYKDEPWYSLLTSGAFLKYIFALMVDTLNFNRRLSTFYINSRNYTSLIPINCRNIREIVLIVRKYGLLKYSHKNWADKSKKKFTEDGIPIGLRNFYETTEDLSKFVRAYEDVFRIEIDMSKLGLENISANNRPNDSVHALKKYFTGELKTHHGLFKKKVSIKKSEQDIFDSEEVQEVIKENEERALEKTYFIESGNLRANSAICNVKKEDRNEHLCKLFGADENGKAKCIEFDRPSSIYTLEYDLNHNVDRASNFDFYQILEFAVLDKLKSAELDISNQDKFNNAQFSYGDLRSAYKLLPMPIFMRGNTVKYISTKMMIIEEKIQEVLGNNINTHIKNGVNKACGLINVNNDRANNIYQIKNHDYELYSAVSQILDYYGLAHSKTNYIFLFSTVYRIIKDHLGHDKRKKHIFFFESLVMIFAQNYLYKNGIEKVVLLYDALFTSDDVDQSLIASCMDRAIIKVKEIVKNYSSKKKKPSNEIKMQDLEEDEFIQKFNTFIRNKKIEKKSIMKFNDYTYFNFFRDHNINARNNDSINSMLRSFGYDVA